MKKPIPQPNKIVRIMNYTKGLKKLAAALLPLVASGSLFAVVIDFQSLEHIDAANVTHGFTYSEDGFTLDNLSTPHPFRTFGTLETRYSGSTALFNDTIGGVTRLTQTGGGAFALNAINLAELNGSLQTVVTFNGYLASVLVATQSFTLDGVAFGQETFNFSPAFANVDQVLWTQDSPFHQFDNIVVNGGQSVPDSSASLALAGVLAGLALLRRKAQG